MSFDIRLFKRVEQFAKHVFAQCPVFFVDTISGRWRLKGALYESRIFQFFEVLRQCALGYGQYFRHVAVVTTRLSDEHLQYRNAHRMR